MHRVFIMAFLFWAALSPALAASTDSTFAVDSYIPDQFRDFEWRLTGNFGFGGEDNNRDYWISDAGTLRTGYSSQSFVIGDLGFSSYPIYRIDSPRRIITARLPLSLSASLNSSNLVEQRPRFDSGDSFTERSSDSRVLYIVTEPSLQADVYLNSSLFTRLKVRSYLRFTEHPEDETETEERRTYLLDGYSVMSHTQGWSSSSSVNRAYSLSASAGMGIGRIWEGQYASTALYIIEELRHYNALLREPTFDEMTALADTVRYFRLVHTMDSRLLRLDALSTILAMLQSGGVVGDVGPYGVYMIQDVWDYFPRANRGFGATASTGVGGDFTYLRRDYSTTTTRQREIIYDHPDTAGYQSVDTLISESWANDSYDQEMARAYYYLDAAWSRPLARQWQLNALGETRVIVLNERDEDSYSRSYGYGDTLAIREEHLDLENDEVYWEVGVSTELLYLYDSRTELRAALEYSFIERLTEWPYRNYPYWEYVDHSDNNRHTVSASLTALYRLSIPTTLTGSATFLYDDYEGSISEYSRTEWGLELGLEHYLF